MFEIKNNEKRICCHLEGLSASEIPVKISCCKCRNCSSVMEQKAYRVSAKRDLYARSPNGSRLKMTMISCFALIFVLVTIAESRAVETCTPEKIIINGVEQYKVLCGAKNSSYPQGYKLEYTYNSNGDWLLLRYYDLGSGLQNSEARFTYDESGVLQKREDYKITDGVAKKGSEIIYKSDLENNPQNFDRIAYHYNCSYNNYTECQLFAIQGHWGNSGTDASHNDAYATDVLSYANIDNYCTSGCASCLNGVCSSCIAGVDCEITAISEGNNDLDELIDDYNDLESCPEGKIAKGDDCIDASQGCGENFRQIENWCNRIRWTPAEAAKVLTDDNNNSVTITFKK